MIAAATTRAAPSATIYAYVHVGVCEREHGIDAARRDLWSYAVVDSYARNFDRAGFADDVAAIRERQAAGDREGAIAAERGEPFLRVEKVVPVKS